MSHTGILLLRSMAQHHRTTSCALVSALSSYEPAVFYGQRVFGRDCVENAGRGGSSRCLADDEMQRLFGLGGVLLVKSV